MANAAQRRFAPGAQPGEPARYRAYATLRSSRRQEPHRARSGLDVAELVGTVRDELATPSVSTALAVLAAVAASDAVCCAVLRMRPRGQDHQQAVVMLRGIAPGGSDMARDLERLLAIKDDAHHGLLAISSQRAATALRQARRLLAAAGAARALGKTQLCFAQRASPSSSGAEIRCHCRPAEPDGQPWWAYFPLLSRACPAPVPQDSRGGCNAFHARIRQTRRWRARLVA